MSDGLHRQLEHVLSNAAQKKPVGAFGIGLGAVTKPNQSNSWEILDFGGWFYRVVEERPELKKEKLSSESEKKKSSSSEKKCSPNRPAASAAADAGAAGAVAAPQQFSPQQHSLLFSLSAFLSCPESFALTPCDWMADWRTE